MKWRADKKHIVIIAFFSVVLIALGIGLVYNAFYSSYFTLSSQYEQHLQDLARSTDRNVGTLMRGVTDELNYGIRQNSAGETEFLKNGNESSMRKTLETSLLMEKSFVSGMQLIADNKIVLCVSKDSECSYDYPFGWTTDAPNICTDGSVNEYFSIIQKSPYNELYYAVLIDLNDFYTRITGSELTEDYWLVLYDINTGVLLQNDENSPMFMDMAAEEALLRNDGFSVVVRAELEQKMITEPYKFNSNVLKDQHHLMSVVPSGDTYNGVFAIGVSIGMSHLSVLLNDVFDKILFSGILVLAGIAVLLLLIYYNRRTNAEMRERVELLELENKEIKELAHHQRLEMIGTMTSGIAHEFNNMLTPIMGYSILAMEQLPEGSEELMDELGEIYDASERAKKLISRISALSRKKNEESISLFSPDELIDSVIETAGPSIPPMVEIIRHYSCPEQCINANETEIGQLILNILINAFQAMDGSGGKVTVSTLRDSGQIVIRIHNTGSYIPEEILPHLFDPFFTTKEPGKGTGLGLAIARQIAENYGGSITAESSIQDGTAFIAAFPDAVQNS